MDKQQSGKTDEKANENSHDARSKQVRSTARNAAMLLLATVVRMVATFGFVVLIADRMTLREFGIYSIGIHYFEFFLALAASAIGILLTREIARWPKHASQLTTSAAVFAMVTTVGAGLVLTVFGLLVGFSDETRMIFLVSSLALFPAAISMVLEAAMVAFEKSEQVAFAATVEVLFRIGLSVFAVIEGWGLIWLFYILVMAKLIQTSILAAAAVYKLGLKIHWRRSRAIRFVRRWPTFAAENWMANLYTNLDILVLSVLSSEVAVGLYSAAWKIIRLGMVVARTYTTAVFPFLTRIRKRSLDQFRQLNLDTIRLMSAISLPLVAVLIVTADRVVDLVYFSGKYVEAVPVLQILAVVLAMEFVNPFLSHTLFARGEQRKSMHVAAIALIVNSITTVLLVQYLDAVGAAIGTVVSGMVATGCYIGFSLERREFIVVADAFVRSALAAICIGGLALLFRESNWLVLGFICLGGFGVVTAIFKVIIREDLEILLSLFKPKSMSN